MKDEKERHMPSSFILLPSSLIFEWSRAGSNRQPPRCKRGALPIELRPRFLVRFRLGEESSGGLYAQRYACHAFTTVSIAGNNERQAAKTPRRGQEINHR